MSQSESGSGSERTHRCGVCGETFETEEDLTRHVERLALLE